MNKSLPLPARTDGGVPPEPGQRTLACAVPDSALALSLMTATANGPLRLAPGPGATADSRCQRTKEAVHRACDPTLAALVGSVRRQQA